MGKSPTVLSKEIQKKTGARNRISIDFDTTKMIKEIPKGQKASAKPDVYQEDVTKIRFPASKSSSSTKPPSVKTTLSERIRFPDKPTRTSPVKISIPSETPETSVTADIQKKIGARNRISIDFDATETTKEIPTENEFNPPRA